MGERVKSKPRGDGVCRSLGGERYEARCKLFFNGRLKLISTEE